MKNKNYVGGVKWNFSDEVYFKLTGKKVESSFNPELGFSIKEIPDLIPNKRLFGLFWKTPTFKDIDSNYLFHVYDNKEVNVVISTSSGNTVEGLARTIKNYNERTKRNIKAILLVPELSSFKVDNNVIENNPYVNYVVLKNSTLDSVREFASEFRKKIEKDYKIVMADADLKTASYAQIGLALDKMKLMNDNTCFVQTVSGAVGPAGLMEAAYQLKANPEILVVQPSEKKTAPVVDALNRHSSGNDPLSIFNNKKYETSRIETTLGSTKPIYAIKKFIKWRENGGRIFPATITEDELNQHKDKIIDVLVKAGVYKNKAIGLKLFEIEKSGFMAFVGTIISADNIKSKNIVVNFTGRCLDQNSPIPTSAKPNILYDPSEGVNKLINLLNLTSYQL